MTKNYKKQPKQRDEWPFQIPVDIKHQFRCCGCNGVFKMAEKATRFRETVCNRVA